MSAVKEIIRKLGDQRYLFLLAVIIMVVGAFSVSGVFPLEVALVVIVGAFLLVILFTVLDYLSQGKDHFHTRIVFKFPQGVDPLNLHLRQCDYQVVDPRNPQSPKIGSLRPYRSGDGWVCPIPQDAKASDRIEFTIIDEANRQWVTEAFVPELQWPSVQVRSQQ